MTKESVGELVQVLGLVLLGAGVYAELCSGQDFWFQIITIGSVIFAIGCKVKGR